MHINVKTIFSNTRLQDNNESTAGADASVEALKL